eukprot:CAMPEP_0175039010 /NCGR_PEP_ID=MMETSP0052_2-20121109/264_1 /TAXON_ID=51329 ORGANISM="Polytomella parva, Strain SAG 63-3" /NCGR_SAMPLE_ID=MMETSP0052_2 /ASSEMBLY_ACC=CAM_ASM_000194 /LENGTH=194 /DNA_ID=CAMNT_0016300651 /DNA_START=61 /DNA_END=641 /DNA_ORIENTATION=+
MSHSNKGPRKDLALIRRLRQNPGCSPTSLLDDGSSILEKAEKLKRFVNQQRTRTENKSTKMDWYITQRQLREEQAELENDLFFNLDILLKLGILDNNFYENQRQSADLYKAESVAIRGQVLEINSFKNEISIYGVDGNTDEAIMIKKRLYSVKEDVHKALDELSREILEIQQNLKDTWPSSVEDSSSATATAIA